MSDHPMIGRVTRPCLRMCISTCAPYSRLICQGYTAVIIIIINVVIIIIIIIIMIPWLFVGTGWIHVWQCRVPMRYTEKASTHAYGHVWSCPQSQQPQQARWRWHQIRQAALQLDLDLRWVQLCCVARRTRQRPGTAKQGKQHKTLESNHRAALTGTAASREVRSTSSWSRGLQLSLCGIASPSPSPSPSSPRRTCGTILRHTSLSGYHGLVSNQVCIAGPARFLAGVL